jgi:hypothetical protein
MIELEDFTFDEDTHTYAEAGIKRLSVTQVLKVCGLIDYSRIPQSILEAARVRGQEVHEITAERDRSGSMPWDWASDTSMARLEAYEWFLRDRGGRIQWIDIEKSAISTVADMRVAGTPDRTAWIDGCKWLIDLKCSETVQASWDLQLALYELMHTGFTTLGFLRRAVLQLLPSGKYKLTERANPADGPAAIGALALATWRNSR